MYIYICIYINTYQYIYISIHINIYIYQYISIYIYIYKSPVKCITEIVSIKNNTYLFNKYVAFYRSFICTYIGTSQVLT